jgi:hypothetical protein
MTQRTSTTSTACLIILYRIICIPFIVRFCSCGELIVSNFDVTTALVIGCGVTLAAR